MTKVQIPKFLAGPIVRRCNVNELAVWLVSSSPVDLSLHIEGYSEDLTSNNHQLRVGDQCFIYLLHTRFHQAISCDELSYKIVADGADVDFGIDQQRDELGCTRVKIPNQLSKVAQGSCRKPHSAVEDALPLLNRLEWSERPELLILSGDQIYADDVSGAMLDRVASQGPPAATIGHLAELLDVNVDQFARPGPFVADDLAGSAIHIAQPAQPVTDQHPMDRGGGHVEDPADPCWPQPTIASQGTDLLLDFGRGAMRTHPGCR